MVVVAMVEPSRTASGVWSLRFGTAVGVESARSRNLTVIHLYPGSALPDLIREAVEKTPRSDKTSVEAMVKEAFALGSRSDFTPAECADRGISWTAFRRHKELFDHPRDVAAVEALNSRWRLSVLRSLFGGLSVPDGATYDEILQAVNEVFAVQPVMDA